MSVSAHFSLRRYIGDSMHRLNFTLDDETISLLDEMAKTWYSGNRSALVRDALHHFAKCANQNGWIIVGFSPVILNRNTLCHGCGIEFPKGEVLYQPIFQQGIGENAISQLPKEPWLDCARCIEIEKQK